MRWLLGHVLFAMLGSDKAIEALARDDWNTTKQNPKPTFDPSCEYVRLRVKLLRNRLLIAGGSMASAVAVALFARHQVALLQLSAGTLGALSAFFAAWAGLARIGWGGQSWSGNTSVERADSYVFHGLCWLALHLGVAGNL
jgi:hypothetical protein